MGSVALRGSVLNSLQGIINKALTALAMLAVAHFLTPGQYGVGATAIAVSQTVAFLLPLTVGDVLIAHPRLYARLAPAAARLAALAAIGSGALIVLAVPVATHFYPDVDQAWLTVLLLVLAVKPLLESRLVLPLSSLRLALAYPAIAWIDGVVQAGATTLSVILAAVGAGPSSLVVPQIAGTAVRQGLYRRRWTAPATQPFRRSAFRLLLRSFLKAVSAQYLHNVIMTLEVLVLGFACGESEAGFFSFAFVLAAQANLLIAFQLGVVLQPILGHLQQDPVRQVMGFLKAQRVLAGVCVPICFTQAIMAEPIFRIAFAEKWMPAIPVFQTVSIAQAFYFATGPSISCLRAQRRFGMFLLWQGVQLLVSVPVYLIGSKEGGALGAAIASGAVWAISSPLVVWLCTKPAPGRWLATSLGVFLKPWLVAAPVAIGAWMLAGSLSGLGRTGDWMSLLLVAPACAAISIWACRFLHEDIRSAVDTMVRFSVARLRRPSGEGA